MYKFTISRPLPSAALVSALAFTLTPGARASENTEKPTTEASKKSPSSNSKAGASTASESSPEKATPTDEEREAARVAFEAGSKAFAEADYTKAHAEFNKAYEVIPSPHAEYWIASALDKGDVDGKNVPSTVAAYEKFLSNPGASHVGAEKVEASQARAAELKKGLPASVTIASTPAGATVSINGEKTDGVTPLTVELAAGTYKVELALEGHNAAEVELVADGGAVMEQQVTLSETPAEQTPAEKAAPSAATSQVDSDSNLVPAAITLGLGGAGLISGTIFGIMALGAKSDFNDNPTNENADKAERNALISDMSFGIALTLGITGIVLLTSDEGESNETASAKSRLMVAPYASKKGGGAAARWSF